jgi:hypothetical protein
MNEAVDVEAEEFAPRERGTCSVGDDWFGRVCQREVCHSDMAVGTWPRPTTRWWRRKAAVG